MSRYSAKLLFQYRFPKDLASRYRTVEERLVCLHASSAKQALSMFKQRGKRDAYRFTNNDGVPVRFEFVGVIEMIHLGQEAEKDEFWYSVRRMKMTREKEKSVVPSAQDLSAFRYENMKIPAK